MTQTDPTSNNTEQPPASSRTGQRVPWRPLIWGLVAVLAIVAGWQLIRILTAPPAPANSAAAPVATHHAPRGRDTRGLSHA